jgi:hypothetical protein
MTGIEHRCGQCGALLSGVEAELLTRDGRLWVSWSIRPEPPFGQAWEIEAVGPNGFNRTASGVVPGHRRARRKIERYRRQWLKESGAKA